MKKITLTLILAGFITCLFAQHKPVKNVILMIPDGTSQATVSMARWYQRYNNPLRPSLHLDPYFCGTVLTFSSNDPIGDSAPTTSCYMSGVPSRAGYVSTYPPADLQNDIIPLDPSKAYQPLMTVMEAAKLVKNKATGLVFTCEFPHATPADCSSHYYNRSNYDALAPQIAHNNIDVVIGGGVKYLNEESRNYLKNEGYGLFLDDINGFRNFKGNKMWSLFAESDMPYDIDSDKSKYPSLKEMTEKAIEKLSQNENGFFLMVEGSKIDWAAHSNDPAGMISEMLAFDEAFGAAVEFAKKDGETVVIALPDHGNSGISIGSRTCRNSSKDGLFKNISQFKVSGYKLYSIIKDTDPQNLKSVFKTYTGIEPDEDQINGILNAKDYNKSTVNKEQRSGSIGNVMADFISKNTCFGFTTGGHTGEEVFMAIYSPGGDRIEGHKNNVEINKYLTELTGVPNQLEGLTSKYFAKHTDVFAEFKYELKQVEGTTILEVTKDKKNKLEIKPFTNIVKHNGKEVKLNTVIVYIDKNETFYLPESLKDILK